MAEKLSWFLRPRKKFGGDFLEVICFEAFPCLGGLFNFSRMPRRRSEIGGWVQINGSTHGFKESRKISGNQIAKLVRTYPQVYHSTDRIQLLSSAVASMFLGRYAATDVSDAAGMNLLNIQTQQLLENAESLYSAPDLLSKLGALCPSSTVLGCVNEYFVTRYGFSKACGIVSFSGDNLCGLGGSSEQPTDLVISLGTSDTVIQLYVKYILLVLLMGFLHFRILLILIHIWPCCASKTVAQNEQRKWATILGQNRRCFIRSSSGKGVFFFILLRN